MHEEIYPICSRLTHKRKRLTFAIITRLRPGYEPDFAIISLGQISAHTVFFALANSLQITRAQAKKLDKNIDC